MDLTGDYLGVWAVHQDLLATGVDPPPHVGNGGPVVPGSMKHNALNTLGNQRQEDRGLQEFQDVMALLPDVELKKSHLLNGREHKPKMISESHLDSIFSEFGGAQEISHRANMKQERDQKALENKTINTTEIRMRTWKNKAIDARKLKNKMMEKGMKDVTNTLSRAMRGRSLNFPGLENTAVENRALGRGRKTAENRSFGVKGLRNRDVKKTDMERRFLQNSVRPKQISLQNQARNYTSHKNRKPVQILAEIIFHKNNSHFSGVIRSLTGWTGKDKNSILKLKGKGKVSKIGQESNSLEKHRPGEKNAHFFKNQDEDQIGNENWIESGAIHKNGIILKTISPNRGHRMEKIDRRKQREKHTKIPENPIGSNRQNLLIGTEQDQQQLLSPITEYLPYKNGRLHGQRITVGDMNRGEDRQTLTTAARMHAGGNGALLKIATQRKRNLINRPSPGHVPSGMARDPHMLGNLTHKPGLTSDTQPSSILDLLLRQAQIKQTPRGLREPDTFPQDNQFEKFQNIPMNSEVLKKKRHNNQKNEKVVHQSKVPSKSKATQSNTPSLLRAGKRRVSPLFSKHSQEVFTEPMPLDDTGFFSTSRTVGPSKPKTQPSNTVRKPIVHKSQPRNILDPNNFERAVHQKPRPRHSKTHKLSQMLPGNGHSSFKVERNDDLISPTESPSTTLRQSETTSLQTEHIKKSNYEQNSQAYSKKVLSHIEEIRGRNSSLYKKSEILRHNVVSVSRPAAWSKSTDVPDDMSTGRKAQSRGEEKRTGAVNKARRGQNLRRFHNRRKSFDTFNREDKVKENLIIDSVGDENKIRQSFFKVPHTVANNTVKFNAREHYFDPGQIIPYSPVARYGHTNYEKINGIRPVQSEHRKLLQHSNSNKSSRSRESAYIFNQRPTRSSRHFPVVGKTQQATHAVSRATRRKAKISFDKFSTHLKKNLTKQDLPLQLKKSSKSGNNDQRNSDNGNGHRRATFHHVRPLAESYSGHIPVSKPASENTSPSVYLAQGSVGRKDTGRSIFSPTKKPLLRLYRSRHISDTHGRGESLGFGEGDHHGQDQEMSVQKTGERTLNSGNDNSTINKIDNILDKKYKERGFHPVPNKRDRKYTSEGKTNLMSMRKMENRFVVPKIYITERTESGKIRQKSGSNVSVVDFRGNSQLLNRTGTGSVVHDQIQPLDGMKTQRVITATERNNSAGSGNAGQKRQKWQVHRVRWFTPNMANRARRPRLAASSTVLLSLAVALVRTVTVAMLVGKRGFVL